MDKGLLIKEDGPPSPSGMATASTAFTGHVASDQSSPISEDVFRLIERGDARALKKMLESKLNASDNGGSEMDGASQLISTEDKNDGDSAKKQKMTCMRMDRHFSSLLFACYSNQLECLKILFEHGMALSN